MVCLPEYLHYAARARWQGWRWAFTPRRVLASKHWRKWALPLRAESLSSIVAISSSRLHATSSSGECHGSTALKHRPPTTSWGVSSNTIPAHQINHRLVITHHPATGCHHCFVGAAGGGGQWGAASWVGNKKNTGFVFFSFAWLVRLVLHAAVTSFGMSRLYLLTRIRFLRHWVTPPLSLLIQRHCCGSSFVFQRPPVACFFAFANFSFAIFRCSVNHYWPSSLLFSSMSLLPITPPTVNWGPVINIGQSLSPHFHHFKHAMGRAHAQKFTRWRRERVWANMSSRDSARRATCGKEEREWWAMLFMPRLQERMCARRSRQSLQRVVRLIRAVMLYLRYDTPHFTPYHHHHHHHGKHHHHYSLLKLRAQGVTPTLPPPERWPSLFSTEHESAGEASGAIGEESAAACEQERVRR